MRHGVLPPILCLVAAIGAIAGNRPAIAATLPGERPAVAQATSKCTPSDPLRWSAVLHYLYESEDPGGYVGYRTRADRNPRSNLLLNGDDARLKPARAIGVIAR